MTFIATVIAKKGTVLIADSLVTTSRPILEYDEFYAYLQSKTVKEGDGEIKIDTAEVIDLFKSKPSHTKDFQEKLFEYGNFTAVATAGAATLNGKSLEDVINAAKKALIKKGDSKKIKERVEELGAYLNDEAVKCLKAGNLVRPAILIITRYSKSSQKTIVYKLYIKRSSPENLKQEGYKCISFNEQPEYFTVVCEGQNRISERILWGDIDTISEIIPKVAKTIFKDFTILAENIPDGYVDKLAQNAEVLPASYLEDIKMRKLSQLSLQQAIDLACLLMRIERDIQKYTENIPTVGGNVKVAVIDDKGFRFLSGHDLKSQSF